MEKVTTTTSFITLKEIRGSGQSRLDKWVNMLFFGNNLQTLRNLVENPDVKGRVRLVYIDPPFATNQEFKSGKLRTSTISHSFEDEKAYEDRLIGAEYIEFLRKRIILLREMLAEDGSIYIHTDRKMGHYVKVLADEIFGQERFINDITRVKCNPKNFKRKGYGNIKDMILFYSKTEQYIWIEPQEKATEKNTQRLFPKDEAFAKGRKRQDVWEFKDPPYPTYPTEKNLEMLKVIIEASSNPADLVLDCFAGSGTTLVAAEELGRRWIGIDNSKIAIDVAQKRLLSIKGVSAFTLYEIREEAKPWKESL